MYKNYSLKTKNVKDEMVKMKNKEKKKGVLRNTNKQYFPFSATTFGYIKLRWGH